MLFRSRFVMDHHIFRIPVLSFIFRTGKTIPIAPKKEDPALLEKAYEDINTALHDGDLVAIFPEGRITDTGELYPFRPGITRILDRCQVPVVPLALRGLWGSFFSRKCQGALDIALGVFRPLWRRTVEIVCSAPVPPEQASARGLELQVRLLRGAVA